MTTRIIAVIVLLATAACGGDGNGSPTMPSVTGRITGLSITSAADLVKLKTSETLTATATFTDGSARSVQPTWATDHPEVATVDAHGRTTATGAGQAVIIAEYQGERATHVLRVVPDYHGLWQGNWQVRGCADEGDWRGLCTEFPAGSLWGLTVAASQNRTAISGTVDFGRLPGPVSGTIGLDGHLTVSGAYTITIEDDITIEIALLNWETITTDNLGMTGRFRAQMRAPWCEGSLTIDGELFIVIKVPGPGTAVAGSRGTVSLDQGLTRIVPRGE